MIFSSIQVFLPTLLCLGIVLMLMIGLVRSGGLDSHRGKGLIVCMETEVFVIRGKTSWSFGGRVTGT